MTDTSTNQMRKAASEAEAEAASGSADTIGEALSALMDSEASELEVHRLLKLAETDPEVKARWKRYQLVRSVLKGDLEVDPQTDLTARISAAISEEQPLRPHQAAWKRWSHGAGKVAIAASVAFAFIVGVQQLGPVGTSPQADVADSTPDAADSATDNLGPRNSVPAGFELPPFAARTVSTGSGARESAPQLFNTYTQGLGNQPAQSSRAIQQHFDQLLIKHAERASTNGNMGLLPFARVPSLEGAEQ